MAIEITKITSRGQIVLPQDIREEAGIKEGEKFIVYNLDGTIILKRIEGLNKVKSIDKFERAFASMWKTARVRKIKSKDISKEIKDYRKERNA